MPAIDLEALQITIAANTASLDRVPIAIKKLTSSVLKMQKSVDASMSKVSSSFQKGANATDKLRAATIKNEAASTRQKVALIRAKIAHDNLITKIRRMTAETEKQKSTITAMAAQASSAYGRQVAAINRSAGATTKLSMANANLQKSLAGIKRQVTTTNFKRAESRHHAFTRAINNLTSASVLAVGPLSGVGARISALGAIANRTNIRMIAFVLSISGLAIGMGLLAKASVTTSLAMEKINAGLRVATGSSSKARKEFAFISSVADKLGQDLTTVSLQYSKLAGAVRGTSITLKDARRIFEGVSLASTALQLTGDETAGMFKALQQIASKGTVQMEELRGQFGERMPGALSLAADAMGITVKELSKITGEAKLSAEVFLPKLADQLIKTFGGPAQQAAKGLRASINRFKNSIFLTISTFDKFFAITSKFQKIVQAATDTVKFFGDRMRGVHASIQGVIAASITFIGLKLAASLITTSLAATGAAIGFEALGFAIGVATMKMRIFLTTNPVGWLILLGSAIVGGIVAYTDYGDAVDGTKLKIDELTKSYSTLLKAKTDDRAENIKDIISMEEVLLAQQKIDLEVKGIDVITGEKFAFIYDRIAKSIKNTEDRIKAYRHELSKLPVVSKEQRDELDRLARASASTTGELKGMELSIAEILQTIEKFRSTGVISMGDFRRAVMTVTGSIKDINAAVEESMKGEVITFPGFTEPIIEVKLAINEQAIADLEASLPVLTFGDTLPFDPEVAILNQRVEAIKTWEEAQVEAYDKAEAAAQRFSNTVSSTFASAAVGGKTMREAIHQVTSSLIQMAAQAWINYLIMKALGFAIDTPNLFNISAPTANGALDPFGGAGPSILENANGGHIRSGQLSIVGEEGAELFRPSTSGTIIPNDESFSNGMTINIDARGASPGVGEEIRRTMENLEERAVNRSIQSVIQLRSNGVI